MRQNRACPGIGQRLVIEITEQTALQNTDATHVFMEDMRQHGCIFALDDFGVGPAAFSQFREFSFEMVKIDGSFIKGLASNPDRQALVSALVGIAQHFDMLTVAEFVESDEQAFAAQSLGVDCLQGYLIGRPELAWKRNKVSKVSG